MRRRRRRRSAARIVFAIVMAASAPFHVGCGSHDATPPPRAPALPAASSTAAVTSASPADAPPTTTLRRSAVHRVVAAGPGAFLQRVTLDVDHPVMKNGKFVGFRILALSGDPSFWSGVDLRPGDVVTRINGLPVEHPEQALEAFRSLEVASELRVDYERDGQPRVLRYAIVDDAAP